RNRTLSRRASRFRFPGALVLRQAGRRASLGTADRAVPRTIRLTPPLGCGFSRRCRLRLRHHLALPVVNVDALIDAVCAIGVIREESGGRGAVLEFVDHCAAEPFPAAGIGQIAARQAVAFVALLQMRAMGGDDRVAEFGNAWLAGAVKEKAA